MPDFDNLKMYSMQIGSFDYYRKIEDKKRRDYGEGQRGLHLIIKKPCEKLDKIIMENGYGHYKVEDLDENGFFKFEYNLNISDHLLEYNTWLLSCSMIDDLSYISVLQKKFECDSYYFITDIDKYINSIQKSLAQSLKDNPYSASGKLRVRHSETESIFLDGWKERVTYINKSKYMEFTTETLSEFMQHNSKTIDQKLWFQKTEMFKLEKEFRFILFPAGVRGTNKRYAINEEKYLLNVNLTESVSKKPVYVQ